MTDQSNAANDRIVSRGPEKRPVTLFSATIIVVANMIGTGVFTTLGFQVEGLQSAFAVLLLWVLGGVGAFCGALCYGELGAMMPRSGGEYTFLSDIYHPALGFLSGWVSIVAGFAAPIALAAIALGEYSAAIFPGLDKTVLAVSAIVILSAVHLTDVKFGCYFQNFFTVGKILIIISLIILGFLVAHPQSLTLLPSRRDLGSVMSPAFATSLVYVFYAYSGWNSSSYIAGEIRHPEKNLPLSLFIGTAIVSVCYVLINFIFLYTVPMNELAGKIDVGFLSAKSIFGRGGGTVMTFLICLALISSLSSLIMVGPRVTQAMGQDMKFFRFLSATNSRGAPGRGHYPAIVGGPVPHPDVHLRCRAHLRGLHPGPVLFPGGFGRDSFTGQEPPGKKTLQDLGISCHPGNFSGALRLDALLPLSRKAAPFLLRSADGGLGAAGLQAAVCRTAPQVPCQGN